MQKLESCQSGANFPQLVEGEARSVRADATRTHFVWRDLVYPADIWAVPNDFSVSLQFATLFLRLDDVIPLHVLHAVS
jgi:hypothetical protein